MLRDGFALSIHGEAPGFLDLARELLLRELSTQTGLDAPPEDVVDEVLERFGSLDVHPDVGPGLRTLADAGVELTAFSNGSAAGVQGLLDRAGLSETVARVLSVEDISTWKPHPAAYAYASGRLQRRADELTLVAVHPWDLDGAARAGWRTAWVDREGAPWPDSFRRPPAHVASFEELAAGST